MVEPLYYFLYFMRIAENYNIDVTAIQICRHTILRNITVQLQLFRIASVYHSLVPRKTYCQSVIK